jgi:hypothetical protein
VSNLSRSSGTKRKIQDALRQAEAAIVRRVEERLRKEFEQRYAKRLRDEVKRREAAEKKAEAAIHKCNVWFREATMWRVRAYRAKSALRSLFIQRKDGSLVRTHPVKAQVGAKRRAIDQQLVQESGALQPRRCGVGGTEYTTRERLLSFQAETELGIGSRHDRSERSNMDRTRRQQQVSVAFYARTGRKTRRSNETMAVDVFVQPKRRAANETRFAMHMLACSKWLQMSRDSVAINLSPDAKTFGPFPTLGCDVDCITVVPDTGVVDAFGNSPDRIEKWHLRPPIQQLASKAVVEKSLYRRKDGGTYPAQTSLKLALMLTTSGVTRGMSENRGAVRFAADGAQDNKGGGKVKETMANMSGTNSIIERLMYTNEVVSEAARILESMGLLGPIEQYFAGHNLEEQLALLIKERLEREKIERKEGAARGATKRALKNLADRAKFDADEATARVAELAKEVDQIARKVDVISNDTSRLEEFKGLLEAAEKVKRETRETALKAKRRFKEAAKRGVEGAGAEPAVAPAAAAAAPVPAVPAESAPQLQHGPLNMSGPIPKCREEQERLFGLKMYEARLRPVLKRQRFWRWIVNMWRYKTQERGLAKLILKEWGYKAQQQCLRNKQNAYGPDIRRLEKKQALLQGKKVLLLWLNSESGVETVAETGDEAEELNGTGDKKLKWEVSNYCKFFVLRQRMRQIDARNNALFGFKWREIADEILSEAEDVLDRVKLMSDDESDDELADEQAEAMSDEGCLTKITPERWSEILHEEHEPSKFFQGARFCGKRSSKEIKFQQRADKKISKALRLSTIPEEDEYRRKANLFWSRFWRRRPTGAAHGVSMESNPCRFWACVDHCPTEVHGDGSVGASEDCGDGSGVGNMCPTGAMKRCEAGTAAHCFEHRLHNFGKQLMKSLDEECNTNLGVVAHAVHNIELGIGLHDAIEALLNPALANNVHSDFFKMLRAAVCKQCAEGNGPSMEEAIKRSGIIIRQGGDLQLEIDEPNEARWIAFFKLAHDLSRAEDFLAIGLIRAKAVGVDEKAEVSAAAAILSQSGFVSEEHPGLIMDSVRSHLFQILVSPQAKESRYMMAAVYQIILHPLLALEGDIKKQAKLMGIGGLPRRLLRILQDVIWKSTVTREFKQALAQRSDNAEVQFARGSIKLLNENCGPDIRNMIGDDLPDSVLDDMVDAVPTLLARMRRLAMMGGRVVPDTTRQIFAFIFGYLYDKDGSLRWERDGSKVEETFAIKISQMQLHFGIMINCAVSGLREAFAREINSPQSFTAGAISEQWSKGTVNGKQVLHPHPDALANVVVMRVMGRDVMADFREQLRARGIDPARKNPLDFLPLTAFIWSEKGTKSSIAFAGMADPEEFEFTSSPAPLEPAMLQGKPIAVDCDVEDHFQNVELLGIDTILSEDRHSKLFPIPIQKYPYLHRLVTAAAAASISSKGVETNWGRMSNYFNTRTNVGFASLSSEYTLPNATAMQLDLASIEKDDLRFRVGLEIGKLPGWRKFYEADKTLRDAMHADFKHAQVKKKGPGFWSQTNHCGSYRGQKRETLTEQDKKAVLSKTLGICKLLGIERDACKIAGYRLQLGLSPSQPRCRAQGQRQPVAEDQQSPRSQSPLPPPSPPSSPPSSAAPPPMPPTPPLSPQLPPLPSPSQQPPPSHADHVDGGVEASVDGGDGSDGMGNIPEGKGGVGGDAGGFAGNGGDDDGGQDEGDEEEESEESEVEFADIPVDQNAHSIAFLYDTFNGCTPEWPTNCDNIWEPSGVIWKDNMGAKAASVTRKPTAHLRRFLETFETAPDAKMTFTVYANCNYLRYMLRQSFSGLVIVKVEAVFEPVGDGDWSKTARIRRVMSTEHALAECRAKINQGVHLARPDLLKFKESLVSYQKQHRPWTVGYEVYHESDVIENVDIRDLIGVVKWYPFRSRDPPDTRYFPAPYDVPTADLIYIGDPFLQCIRRGQQRR